MPGKEIKGRSKIANYRYGGRIGFKKGTNKKNGPVRPIDLPFPTPENPVPSKKVSKKPKKPSSPSPSPSPSSRPDKILKKPSSPHLDKPKSSGPPKGGSRPGPSKGPSPKTRPKVEEDWAAKGGRIK